MATFLFGASAVRREILRYFFARPSVEDHVRAVARVLERDPAAVGRELDRLERTGILTSIRRGRSRRYRLSTGSRVVEELRPLVQRTVGVEGRLTEALAGLPGLRDAFIFGSYARGTESAQSDIDLMIVGDPDGERLWGRLIAAERDLGRRLNVTEYTAREFDRLRRQADPFLRSVIESPTVHLAGRNA